MKRFIKLLIFCVIFAFGCFSASFSDELKPTVAVITDINHRAGTIYLVTGASTDIIASDIISSLNESNLVYAPGSRRFNAENYPPFEHLHPDFF